MSVCLLLLMLMFLGRREGEAGGGTAHSGVQHRAAVGAGVALARVSTALVLAAVLVPMSYSFQPPVRGSRTTRIPEPHHAHATKFNRKDSRQPSCTLLEACPFPRWLLLVVLVAMVVGGVGVLYAAAAAAAFSLRFSLVAWD